MAITLRDVCASDLDAVLALNNNAGPGILPIDRLRLRSLFEIARYFRVAEVDGVIAGFIIGMSPDACYDSPNFNYFRDRFEDFFYIDRVVIAGAYRRHGIGRVIYADVLSFSEVRSSALTCEVFIDPRDDVSLVFFGTQGFTEIGQQSLSNGRRVSMMVKSLEQTLGFVRAHYLEGSHGGPSELWHDRLKEQSSIRLSA